MKQNSNVIVDMLGNVEEKNAHEVIGAIEAMQRIQENHAQALVAAHITKATHVVREEKTKELETSSS